MDTPSARIQEFAEQYMDKLFYFCLKKTGNSWEAEDLTADIALCVVSELRRGVVPLQFPAWVWRIARNRYSAWAAGKHKRGEQMVREDVADLALAADTQIEEEYIRREDAALLRRELAFLSSAYRDIVVAYYLQDCSVREIAQRLNLPEGTVKSKLFRARQYLKEGMQMAREFGARSYTPENVGFIMNGRCGVYGEPQTLIGRRLVKNILLAAYRTPSTAEELSVELGVALPYMEDELERLVGDTLLRRQDGRYESNLYIVSAAAQGRIYAHARETAPAFTRVLEKMLEYDMRCCEENGSPWSEGYQPFADAKWAMLMRLEDAVGQAAWKEHLRCVPPSSAPAVVLGQWGYTARPNGGEWDLLGLEDYAGDRPVFVGEHGCGFPDSQEQERIDFGQFKFQYKQLDQKTPVHLNYEEGRALVNVAGGDWSGVRQSVLDRLERYGYLKKEGDRYRPTFLVIQKSRIRPRTPEQEAVYRTLWEEAVQIRQEHDRFCCEVIEAEVPDFLRKDRHTIDHACSNMAVMRGAVFEEALRTGYIVYEDDDPRIMLGAYLILD